MRPDVHHLGLAHLVNVHARRLEDGLEEQLTHFAEDSIQAFAWSPDRGRMVVTRGRVTRDLVLLKNFR